jgi:hypothetical protein
MDAGCHVAQRLERERERERMVGPCREWLAAMTVETFCLEIPPKADENRVADSMSTRQARWGGVVCVAVQSRYCMYGQLGRAGRI